MKTRKIIILIISFAFILMLGSSYALLRTSRRGTNSYTTNVGLLEITFKDNVETLTLNNAYPMTDEEGMEQSDELVFSIKNTGELDTSYNVYIEETSPTLEFKNVIRYVNSKNNWETFSDIKTLSEDKYIEQDGYLKKGAEVTYNVKCWLAENADNTYMNKIFSARIVVEALQKNVVIFNANGGEVSPEVKSVEYEEIYGELPIPVKPGYTFLGWNGKNILDYTSDSIYGGNGFLVSDDGYISDESPTNDSRSWIYDESNWKTVLEAGTYTVTLNFLTKATSENAQKYSKIVIIDKSTNNFIIDNTLYDIENYTKTFTLSEKTNIGIEVKCYDGIYRIQLEKGNHSTTWEPYYVKNNTIVTQSMSHILTSKYIGKNILNYKNIAYNAKQSGIVVDNNGYISDNTYYEDSRTWSYLYSNWQKKLDAGTYTITLEFSKNATSSSAKNYSTLAILNKSNNSWITSSSLYDVSNVSKTFTLNETTDIGIQVKGFDGIYRIQLEKGSLSTEWNSFYSN